MIKKAGKILPWLLSVILTIALSANISQGSSKVSYEEYVSIIDRVRDGFEPERFNDINISLPYPHSRITSYPSSAWTGESNNAYQGESTKPRQIEFFYLSRDNQHILTKVTFSYAPESFSREYLKADYFESLEHAGSINEVYRDLTVTPQEEVGFKGRGYYAFVQTAYLDPYYRTAPITDEENSQIISVNADLVRQLQEFFLARQL